MTKKAKPGEPHLIPEPVELVLPEDQINQNCVA